MANSEWRMAKSELGGVVGAIGERGGEMCGMSSDEREMNGVQRERGRRVMQVDNGGRIYYNGTEMNGIGCTRGVHDC